MNNKTSQLSAVILALVLLIIFTVLILGAASRYMREDEAIALDGTAKNIPETILRQINDVHLPLYFVSFYLWQEAVGRSEFTGRIFSLLVSMITLSVVYLLGQRWFGSSWAGLAAMLALGFSSYFFRYSIEIRPYSQLMLLSALSMWFFVRWLHEQSRRSAIMYGVTIALIFYLHYFGTFLILIQGIYFVLRGKPNWTLWRQGLIALGFAFVCWLPWLPLSIYQILRFDTQLRATGKPLSVVGLELAALPTNAPTISGLIMIATNLQPVLFLVTVLVGGVLLWRRGAFWLALIWGIGLPLAMLLVNLVVPVYEPRYASQLLPGLALLLGGSLAALPGRWKYPALTGFSLLTLSTAWSGAPNLVPLRDLLREFNSAYHPGDGVYLDHTGNDNQVWIQYSMYAPSAWPHAQWIDNGELLQQSSLPRCVWHITPAWFNPDVQERFKFIESTHPLQRVIGDQRYLFQELCAPPEVDPHLFGDSLIFRGVDIESQSKQQIVLKLWWNAAKVPAYDYSFGIYLLNEAGAVVAQHDGPIESYWGNAVLQTSSLKPGAIYVDHPALTLPPDLPPGQYQLGLKVYQSWDLKELSIEGTDADLLVFSTVTLP